MRIGLISCTKSKTPYPAPARELYQPSALFRGALAYLEPRVDTVYVLSAKYGLLSLDQEAAPYDQTLKDASGAYRRNWARRVCADLQARHGPSLEGFTFEFHAGEAYSAELRSLLEAAGAHCTSPVEGLTIGGRLHFYAATAVGQSPVTRLVLPQRAAHLAETDQVRGLKIHVEVWLAAALLHDAGHATFAGAQLAQEIERRFGDTRPGIQTHIVAHCVANAPKNTMAEYSYLSRTDWGEYRLHRAGDPLHPSRSGSRTAPDQVDIPEVLWDTWRKWR